MTKEWRKLCNEELHNLYCLSNIGMIKSRRMSWVGHLTYTRQERSSYRVFVGKPEVKKTTFKIRWRYEENIKMPLKKMDWQDLDWISLAQEMFIGVHM